MKMKYLLCADLHLMSRKPPCRGDDHIAAQIRMLDQIAELSCAPATSLNSDAHILHAGDLFDKWDDYKAVLLLGKHIPKMTTIFGNHDLHNNSFEDVDMTAMKLAGLLRPANVIEKRIAFLDNVAMIHEFVVEDKAPFFMPEAPSIKGIVRRMRTLGFNGKLILCGDNHQTFYGQFEDCWVVNPGAGWRFTADLKDHQPQVFMYDSEANTVTPINLDVSKDVITTDYLERQHEVEQRFSNLIEAVDSNTAIEGINFFENLVSALQGARPEVIKYVLNKKEESE